MATPSPSTTTTTISTHTTPLLTIYAATLSLLSAITVTTVFYLIFGLQGAIVTLALYVSALLGIICWKRLVETVCYPRYVNLSERRRGEVDEVRVRGITRLLEGVTLILEKEHLMQKPLQGKSDSSVTSATMDSSASSSSPLEHFSPSLECTTEDDEEGDDLELGHHLQNDVLTNAHNGNNDDLPSSYGENDVESNSGNNISVIVQLYKTEDEETASSSSSVATTESAEMEYTHVRIPCPGMMQCPNSSDSSSSIDADASSTPSPLALKENTLMSTTTTSTTPPRTREVSKNCPICLSTYEPHDRICYSSNSECSHVFHCDCIIRWFVEMGRQNNDIVIGHGTKLDESLLLDYTLSCPCCRQPFVTQNDDDDELPNKKNKGNVDDTEEKKNGVASEKKRKNEKTSKVTIPRSTSFTSFSSCKIMPVMEMEEDDRECPV